MGKEGENGETWGGKGDKWGEMGKQRGEGMIAGDKNGEKGK